MVVLMWLTRIFVVVATSRSPCDHAKLYKHLISSTITCSASLLRQ